MCSVSYKDHSAPDEPVEWLSGEDLPLSDASRIATNHEIA